jgi:hypothetical protein
MTYLYLYLIAGFFIGVFVLGFNYTESEKSAWGHLISLVIFTTMWPFVITVTLGMFLKDFTDAEAAKRAESEKRFDDALSKVSEKINKN